MKTLVNLVLIVTSTMTITNPVLTTAQISASAVDELLSFFGNSGASTTQSVEEKSSEEEIQFPTIQTTTASYSPNQFNCYCENKMNVSFPVGGECAPPSAGN